MSHAPVSTTWLDRYDWRVRGPLLPDDQRNFDNRTPDPDTVQRAREAHRLSTLDLRARRRRETR